MPVLLDDAALPLVEPTLAAALAAARSTAESRRRVITDVLLDGRPIPDDALDRADAGPLPRDARLQFVTADPVVLVQASLRDAAEAIGSVRGHQQAAATAIQRGQINEAMPSLSEAFTIWDTARKVVTDGCGLLGLDPSTLAIELGDGSAAVPLAGAVKVLVTRLTEVKRCLTAQDWCGLSDVLAYDLPADADLWEAMLRALADRLPEVR